MSVFFFFCSEARIGNRLQQEPVASLVAPGAEGLLLVQNWVTLRNFLAWKNRILPQAQAPWRDRSLEDSQNSHLEMDRLMAGKSKPPYPILLQVTEMLLKGYPLKLTHLPLSLSPQSS